ncbi:MAG: choice-of-anchor X domain-containing protein [Caldilineaceae bacterium]
MTTRRSLSWLFPAMLRWLLLFMLVAQTLVSTPIAQAQGGAGSAAAATAPSAPSLTPDNPTALVLNENFEIPANTATGCDKSFLIAKGWTDSQTGSVQCWVHGYGSPTNMAGGANGFMWIAGGGLGNAVLTTPVLDLSQATAVTLRYNMRFSVWNSACYATSDLTKCSVGNLRVKTEASPDWVTVKSYVKTNLWAGLVSVDLSAAAAGHSQVQIAFDFQGNGDGSYWIFDDLQIEASLPPAAPTGVTATAQGTDTINLSWATVSGASGYKIEESPNGVDQWAEIAATGTSETSRAFTGLSCGSTHHYRVRALNTSGASSPSAGVSAATGACALGPVLNEDFSTGSVPNGWTVVATNPDRGSWLTDNPNDRKDGAGNNSGFALVDNPKVSSNAFWTAELRSPTFSLANVASAALTFDSFMSNAPWGGWRAMPTVDVSTDNGATWQNGVWSAGDYFGGPRTVFADLTAVAAGQSAVKVRFQFADSLSGPVWYWIVDNVKIESFSAPAAPTDLQAIVGLDGKALLSWQNQANTSKVQIERAVSGGSFQSVGEVGSNVTKFTDAGGQLGQSYTYRVRASNSAGPSPYSAVANLTLPAQAVGTVVDVNIGLYYDPAPISGRQSQFENIALFFADTIYEASNGGVKIRRVTFYPNQRANPLMDVDWNLCATGGCYPNSSLGRSRSIQFWDYADQVDQGSLSSQEQTANTLAHEFGHYHFTMYDEYTNDGQNTPYSLMSGLQNRAVYAPQPGQERDYRWLNFATNANYASATFNLGTETINVAPKPYLNKTTGQRYAAWDALATNPTTTGLNSYFYHPELGAFKPADMNQLAPTELDKPNGKSNARSAFEVCWVNTCKRMTQPNGAAEVTAASRDAIFSTVVNARAIVIERSAATTPADRLDDLKSGAKQLIDDAQVGDAFVVLAYDGAVSVVQPLTLINGQADKTTLQAAVDGITVGDADVALGDALQSALAQVIPTGEEAGPGSVVYLLSSGQQSIGAAAIAAIPDYQAALLPLFVFDYGNAEDSTTTLQLLAAETNSSYYAAGSSLGSLLNALSSAQQKITLRETQAIKIGAQQVETAAPLNLAFPVDDSLGEVAVNVIGDSAIPVNGLAVHGPNNETVNLTCEAVNSNQAVYCNTTLVDPAVGSWSLQGMVTATTTIDYWIKGAPKTGSDTFRATLTSDNGFLVTHPDPIRLTATLQRGDLVAGLSVQGTLVDPYGTAQPLQFRDDGVSPDPVAADGIYSALYVAQINGDYHAAVDFDNGAGSGQLTAKGLVVESEVTVDGDGNVTITPPTLTTTPVTANFARRAELVLTVTGAPIIGPNGERAGDVGPVELTPNNAPVSGRITVDESSTRYKLTVPADFQGDLFVRITSLELGMNPAVELTNEASGWSRSVANAQAADLFIPVPAAPGDTIYIDVAHVDPNATQGVYAISAGAPQPQDLAAVAPDPGLVAPGVNVYLPLINK